MSHVHDLDVKDPPKPKGPPQSKTRATSAAKPDRRSHAALPQLLAPTPKRGLRPAQVAAKCGVSIPTVWRWARNNPLFPRPSKPSERVTLFDEGEVDAFLAACKVAA